MRQSLRKFFLNIQFYYLATRRLELYNKAASLSYYTVISLFPMLLFTTALVGYFLPLQKIMLTLPKYLDEVLPLHSELISTNILALFKYKTGFTWFGLISLFISAQMLYVNLERIINRILHVEKNRHFVLTRLFFLVWLIAMVFVLFTPLVLELLQAMITSLGWKISLWATISSKGGFLLSTFLVFCFVMLILPTKRLEFMRVIEGALFFALTVQGGKLLFKWVTVHNLDRYNLIYGSLSSIVLGLLWIFYFYNMFLFFVYWVGRTQDPLYRRKKGLPEDVGS